MAVIETWLHQDLQEPVKVNHLDGNLFSNNGNGNRIGVVLTNNGEALASISGTVSGYVVTADGSTVPCTGSKSGNRASILIPAAAYQPGSIFITVFITDGTTVTTVAAVSTTVMRSRTNAQVDPGSVVTDWTQTINAAMQSVETAAENLGGIVAVPYASITFPVPLGKYTYYNNNLYRCISPIASSESFTPAHWSSAINMGDEVSSLKSAFVNEQETDIAIQNETNLIDYTAVTTGKRVYVSDGTLGDNESYSASDYIPVIYGGTIILNFSVGSDLFGYAFYDDSKTFVSAVSGNDAHSAGDKFAVPKGSFYMRLTMPNTELASGSETAEARITTPWNNEHKDIRNVFSGFLSAENMIAYNKITANKRITVSNGAVVDATNQSLSDFIPVVYGEIIDINFTLGSDTYGHAFYDANKQFISAVSGNSAGKRIPVIQNAAYIRFTIPNTEVVSGSETAKAFAIGKQETNDIELLRSAMTELFKGNNLLNYSTITTGKRIRMSDIAIVDGSNYSVSDYIPVVAGEKVTVNFEIASATYGHGFYDQFKNPINKVDGNTVRFANNTFEVPVNACYMRMTIPNTALVSGSETALAYYVVEQSPIVEKTKWLAVGDSITKGVYSYVSGDSATSGETEYSWVKLLADSYNYDLTIMASRGMGYVRTGKDPNGGDARIDLNELLTRIEALDIDVNLITLAFGVNDYNSIVDDDSNPTKYVTLQNIKDSFDDAVERLMTKFPEARLVVITPFNCCNHGNAGTNYGYNQVVPATTPTDPNVEQKTLKQVADTIKERCDVFGIECIYASNGFLFNNFNIQTLQPDKVHPSLKGHTLIAKNMIHYLIN